jgi:hypothetical protein
VNLDVKFPESSRYLIFLEWLLGPCLHLTAYLQSPCRGVLLDTLIACHLVEKFSSLYGTRNSLPFSQEPTTDPILSQNNPIHTLTLSVTYSVYDCLFPSGFQPKFCAFFISLRSAQFFGIERHRFLLVGEFTEIVVL